MKTPKLIPPLSLALLVLSSCATNPATGARQLMLVSEGQEIRMGREADPQIIAQFGLHPDSSTAQYVRGLGERLAAGSERPDLPWTFRVLDDPTVNAFALPGGFNYVTRGIMAHLNSEAELAAVMGHEIGHVTARHSAQQLSKQQLAQVGLVAGVLLAPELEDFAGLASAGLGLLFLKFSRDHERQADDLGLRYMTRAGYDPREMPRLYDMLGRVSAAAGGGRLPGWLSTHPDPADRRERIEQRVDSLSRTSGTTVNRREYLRRLDGMTYGVNPREGFFREQAFLHPDLRFRLEFPRGWKTVNQKQAVLAQSPREDAIMQLTLSDHPAPASAARAFLAQEGVSGGPVRVGDVNGHQAASAGFRASTEQGVLRGLVTYVSYNGNLYQLLAFARQEQWGAYRGAVEVSFNSFDRLTDRTALSVQPLRLEIVTLDQTMTLQQFAARYPSRVPVETLALLNGVEPGAMLAAGQLAKRVVGGPLP
ncbi:MAG: M48 family metalloprotease [Gemmatimonadales bacterium]|nr:M48 family metalloprotease [Gemmatimonadales bacterium]NIN50096.1 M48 family metalloprotease [Gemmatimonadales bacterium]NIP07560.1 M48 family metalloprotease [Gemmatimonadales bacterium]NIR01716.1 M48 family metalloprotease [Gemmatimonadales bacterium]NIS65619.1 M48 family metalloprotease [Gemmatimonadales bacterium]